MGNDLCGGQVRSFVDLVELEGGLQMLRVQKGAIRVWPYQGHNRSAFGFADEGFAQSGHYQMQLLGGGALVDHRLCVIYLLEERQDRLVGGKRIDTGQHLEIGGVGISVKIAFKNGTAMLSVYDTTICLGGLIGLGRVSEGKL